MWGSTKVDPLMKAQFSFRPRSYGPSCWIRLVYRLVFLWCQLSTNYFAATPHLQTSPNFLCVLSVAMAGPSFAGVMVRYVLPVLWMTLCFCGLTLQHQPYCGMLRGIIPLLRGFGCCPFLCLYLCNMFTDMMWGKHRHFDVSFS